MGIFEENKAIFAYSGLGTSQFIQFFGRNVPRSFIRLYVLSFSTLICVLEGVLCIRFLNYDLVDCLSSFVCLLGFFPAVSIYISLIMKTNVINQLFDYLENVINTRRATESLAIYQTSNANTNKIIRTIISYGYKIVFMAFVVPALCPLLYIAIGFPSPDFWFTPLAIENLSTVFKTPIGFTLIVAINLFASFSYMITFGAFTTIYVVISRNIDSIAGDMSMIVAHLNAKITPRTSVKDELKRIVQFHLHTYEVMDMFNDIMRGPIFYQIAGFAVQIGLCLYLFEVKLNENSANVATYVGALLYVSFSNYILCHFVSHATLHAMSIGDRIYDLLWYQLPCDERILVQLIIQFANQPYELKGFGIFVCSFDTFLKMLHGAVSYYMVFRRI